MTEFPSYQQTEEYCKKLLCQQTLPMRLFVTIERISTIQVLPKFLDHNIFLEISQFDSVYMSHIFSLSRSHDVSRGSFCPRMDLVLQIKTIHPIKHRNPQEETYKQQLISMYSSPSSPFSTNTIQGITIPTEKSHYRVANVKRLQYFFFFSFSRVLLQLFKRQKEREAPRHKPSYLEVQVQSRSINVILKTAFHLYLIILVFM